MRREKGGNSGAESPKEASAVLLRCVPAVILLVILDQASKYQAARTLKGGQPLELIPGVLELRYLYPENRGIAFGMFQGGVLWFALLSIALLGVIGWFYLKIPAEKKYLPLRIACILMASGAAGNGIDRVLRRYVIDFIYISLIRFPIFNLADVYVVSAGILLILLVLFVYRGEHDFDFAGRQ